MEGKPANGSVCAWRPRVANGFFALLANETEDWDYDLTAAAIARSTTYVAYEIVVARDRMSIRAAFLAFGPMEGGQALTRLHTEADAFPQRLGGHNLRPWCVVGDREPQVATHVELPSKLAARPRHVQFDHIDGEAVLRKDVLRRQVTE